MDTMIEPAVFEDTVRIRAYALWESEGRPNGRDAEHWFRCQEEYMRRTAPPVRTAPPFAKPRAKKKSAKSV